MWDEWFFELEEGFVDQDGAVLCPVCLCCSLKQVPRFIPSLFTFTNDLPRSRGYLSCNPTPGLTGIVPHRHAPLTHCFLSRYSPGTSSCGTSWVRISLSSVSPASSRPFTTSASNAFPSSSNSSTLPESARWTLDNPCKSPDCSPDRSPSPSGANATASTLLLFPRTCFLSAPAVFPPVVFLPPTFVFSSPFFGAAFFLGVVIFLASFFLNAFF